MDQKKLLTKATRELNKTVLEDGSAKGENHEEQQKHWYHHTGLIETIITLEMARKHDIRIPSSLGSELKRAGEIFIQGFKDHSYMDKWAKVAPNSIFTPGRQDFRNNLDLPNGNSWLYIFLSLPKPGFDQKIRQDSCKVS